MCTVTMIGITILIIMPYIELKKGYKVLSWAIRFLSLRNKC